MRGLTNIQILSEIIDFLPSDCNDDLKGEIEKIIVDEDIFNTTINEGTRSPQLEYVEHQIIRSIPTIEDDCGFSGLVAVISEMKKPIIAHNGFIDR
jgi:hypothetical protein